MTTDDSHDLESDGRDWLETELEETLGEDYELELSEPALSMELRRIYKHKHPADAAPHDLFPILACAAGGAHQAPSGTAPTANGTAPSRPKG